MHELSAHYSDLLAARRDNARLRTLREIMPGDGATVYVNGRQMVDFASNDYLGLSTHPLLKQRSIEYTNRFGVGSGASRLLSGNIVPFEYIERKLAALKGTEAALLLPTGFQANATVLAALADKQTQVLCDKLSHHSLLSGAMNSEAKWSRFAHNSIEHLEQKIAAAPQYTKRIIVTESVFSMDGDIADINALAKAATACGAMLYIDEAHATGVLGDFGMGLTARRNDVAVSMGTFGKAAGGFGAYIACTRAMRDYLINFCGGFVYSTALPPPVLGAIDAALDLIPSLEQPRRMLIENAEHVRNRLKQLGFGTASSQTQIIPIIVGDDASAVSLANYLEDAGIFAPAIRPPTVPEGLARVRISLTTEHTREQLERLCVLMRNWRGH